MAFFEITDFRDLFKKAKRDFDKLNNLSNTDDLFNFVCTLNHVRDWITKDTNLDEDLKKHALELTKSSDNIKSVNSMCNGAKHANYEEETIVSAGYGMGRFGVGNYGVGEVSLKIYRNGEKERVLDIAKAAIDDWENFFTNEEIKVD